MTIDDLGYMKTNKLRLGDLKDPKVLNAHADSM